MPDDANARANAFWRRETSLATVVVSHRTVSVKIHPWKHVFCTVCRRETWHMLTSISPSRMKEATTTSSLDTLYVDLVRISTWKRKEERESDA